MEVKAKAKDIRISPRKVRLVVDLVRGKRVDQALDQLRFLPKKASHPVAKVIDSAIANAFNNYDLKKDNLYIREIRVDEGRTLRRWTPRAYGRATPIRKRTSHIVLTLGEIVDSGEVAPKKQEIESPVSLEQMTQQEGASSQKKQGASSGKSDKKKEDKGSEVKNEGDKPGKKE